MSQPHIATQLQFRLKNHGWALEYNFSFISLPNTRLSDINTDFRQFAKLWTLDEIVPRESMKAVRSHVQQGLPQGLLQSLN